MASERIQRRIDRLLDEADDAVSRFDWEAVRERAQAVLAFDSENDEALAFLTAAQKSLGMGDASPVVAESAASRPLAAPLSDEPTSFSDGRYQVQKFLGEGGKKMVYLAQDTLLDRDVAFALIKTDGLDAASRERISREAQAMGRLGSHPHIVTVFDLGEHEGQPFMVVELLGGGDVEGILEDAEDGRLPLKQAISIAVETCRGLDFAHSRGIIHRDLKPGNVWLTENGVAKIGDFGLAVSMDRSRLTAEGMMVGTVSYMPPEQAMGGEVTPRADLYSLGAMLYEMVCGRPPFLGDDNIAIIGQHINTPPVAPTWHRSDCPRPLEALIMRLLSKDPSERPESASDVLAALESIDISRSEQSIAEPEQASNVLDSLAGDVFVGRQREMDELKAALEDALGGRGRMVTLVGEPGIGKTRTAQELATYARLRGCQVLWGRCYEEQGVPPYWPWVQAIRSYVRDREPEGLNSDMGAGAADIAEIVSDVRERLPGLPRPSHMDDPESARFRLFDSITAFLKSAAERRPLVLVLDDLHWSDQPSLGLMQFIVRELSGARLLLIGTYRDVELNRRHPLAGALGNLTRERLFSRVLLRGLSHDDVGRFIEVTSGVAPPSSLVDAVHTQTEGNPLFVTEVVRLLVQEGEFFSDESTANRESWAVRIPEGVREVIGRRLNQLSARCNDMLTVASVLGREFELRQLAALTDDLTEDMLLDVLEEGLDARVIEETLTAVGRFQFTHALIQETLAEELSLTRRVRLHARIGETLEEMYRADVERHASELALHFVQAEASLGPEKMTLYSMLAGEQALAAYAHEDALGHFQQALSGKSDKPMDSETADILFGLGQAEQMMLRVAEALEHLHAAFDYYEESGDSSRAAAVASVVTTGGALSDGMAPLRVRALALVSPESIEAGWLQALRGRDLGVRFGDYDGAQVAFDRALALAERHGNSHLKLRILTSASGVDAFFRCIEGAISKALDALDLLQSIDSPWDESFARMNLTFSLVVHGRSTEAKMHGEAALIAAEKLGDIDRLATVCDANALAFTAEGDWERAREFSDRGLSASPDDSVLLGYRLLLESETGEADSSTAMTSRLIDVMGKSAPGATNAFSMPPYAIGLAGRIFGATENFDLARKAGETVLSSPRANPHRAFPSRVGLGLMAAQTGDVESVREHYEALITESFGSTQIDSHRVLGIMVHALNRLDDAAEHFEEALRFTRGAGYLPELAWSLHDYADMLLLRDRAGDQQTATAMLDEALQISTDLGMRPLMERVLSKRDILKA